MIDSFSVVIITKNSAGTLARTLRSVERVKEVVVYDNGSTDDTLKVAAQFSNVKIFSGEFFGFGPTKNYALTLASNDWVFVLDSDEVFTPKLVHILESWQPGDPEEVFRVRRDNYFMGKRIRFGGWGRDWLVRLFNRTTHRFTDAMVHEKVELQQISKKRRLAAPIEHFAVEDIRSLVDKINLYSEIRKETLDKTLHPSVTALRSFFTFFKSYVFQVGFLEGWRGLVIAVYNANSVFFKYIKIYAEQGRREVRRVDQIKICHMNLARLYRGGERQTEMLVKVLAGRGIAQRVILRKDSALTSKLRSVSGVEVVEISGPLLKSARIGKGFDLIHAHEARAAHLALFNYWFTGVPYLITRRVPNLPGNDPLTKRVYGEAATIVALSRAIRSVMLQYDPELDVRIIPSMMSHLPVNPQNVERLREEYKGKFIAGHIGALQMRHKGQQYLIEAAADLAKTHPDIHFLLLGEGEDEQVLRRQAAGLKNLEFVGFCDDVGDYLAIFDLFVFPSLKEGLGSTLLDAMEFGKAIIAADVDGIREIVRHDYNGLLVAVADAQAIRDAMLELYNDRERSERLGQNAQSFVKDFSPEITAESYIALYRRLLGLPPRALNATTPRPVLVDASTSTQKASASGSR